MIPQIGVCIQSNWVVHLEEVDDQQSEAIRTDSSMKHFIDVPFNGKVFHYQDDLPRIGELREKNLVKRMRGNEMKKLINKCLTKLYFQRSDSFDCIWLVERNVDLVVSEQIIHLNDWHSTFHLTN
jgi:hypothetical protein